MNDNVYHFMVFYRKRPYNEVTMNSKRWLLSLLIMILASCGIQQSGFSYSSSQASDTSTDQTSSEINSLLHTFWAPSTRLKFSLKMQEAHVVLLNDLGKEKNGIYNDLYIPVQLNLTVNDEIFLYDDVGIRLKGNIFSRGPFLEQGMIIRPFHFRLRFNETFDDDLYEVFNINQDWQRGDLEYQMRKQRQIFGLEALEFKWNRSNDPSLINQVFGANQYLQRGSLAARATLAEVQLSDQKLRYQLGLFTITEPIDDLFIARHFQGQAANGDLYKMLFPVDLRADQMGSGNLQLGTYAFYEHMVGVEDTFKGYHPVYDLKTNKKSSSHQALKRLISALELLRYYPLSTQLNHLKTIVDIESFLQYAAISYLIGNPDDMRNNKNNTYLYFDGVTQLAYFIPYDLDWSLGVTWDPQLTIFTSGNHPYSPMGTYGIIGHPLYWYTIFERINHPYSNDYPLQSQTQLRYRQYVLDYFHDGLMTIAAYQTLMTTYQDTYDGVISSLATNSMFQHGQRFTHHLELLGQRLQTI